jgi:hypothetical protein
MKQNAAVAVKKVKVVAAVEHLRRRREWQLFMVAASAAAPETIAASQVKILEVELVQALTAFAS